MSKRVVLSKRAVFWGLGGVWIAVGCGLSYLLFTTSLFTSTEDFSALRLEVLSKRPNDTVHDASEAPLRDAWRSAVQAGDVNTVYLDRVAFSGFRKQLSSNSLALGVDVLPDIDGLRVIQIEENSPADRHGLRVEDQIISIDGAAVQGWSVNEFLHKLQLTYGRTVKLGVLRAAQLRYLDIAVERISKTTVSNVGFIKPQVGYIKITHFEEGTPDDFQRALHELEASCLLEKLVIDLRDNRGGNLQAALQLVSDFLEQGTLILTTWNALKGTEERYYSEGAARPIHYPILILTNRATASAAEIVAGVLQSEGIAQVAGTRTEGKGTVQRVLPFSNGEAVKYTLGFYALPDGTLIEGKGVIPDSEVPLDLFKKQQ